MSCLRTSECSCEIGSHGGILVNCNGRSLTKIPSFELNDLSAQIYEISLKDNAIKEIPANSFNGTILKRLDISNNPLASISAQAFAGVEKSLTELSIGSDQSHIFSITSIPLQTMVSLERLSISNFNDLDINETSLNKLKNLKELSLTEGYLENISPLAFQFQSDTLEKLDLSENKFKAMPVDALSKLTNLKSLSLNSNYIKAFEEGAFDSFRKLRILNIDRLNRPVIERRAFRGLIGSLEILNMATSSFSDPVLDEIKDLTSLTHLYASYNEFTRLDKFLDGSLSRLKLLDLQDNLISKIDHLESSTLETLILENNPIIEVSSDAFHGLPSLQSLNLNNAKGLKLNEDTFKSQSLTMKELRMNQVNLSNSYWKAFSTLNSLEILGASGCDFSEIPDFLFYSLSRLKTLILDENGISSLSQRSFHGLGSSLRHLSLTGNKLATLEECVFYNFNAINVAELKLDRNPLVCDCKMKWLYDRIKVLRARPETAHLVLLLQWRCENLNLKFNSLTDEHFKECSPNEPPTCEEFLEFSTTAKPNAIPAELHVTDIRSNSFVVQWNGSIDEYSRHILSYEKVDGERHDVEVASGAFQYQIENLEPSSTYVIYLTIISSGSINKTFSTTATTISWIDDHREQVIIGTSLGIIFFFLALFIFALLFCIYSRKPNVPVVEITEHSKRYVKSGDYTTVSIRQSASKPTVVRSDEIIKSTLDNMTEEEKYRLVNLLTNSRGSIDALDGDQEKKHQMKHIYEEIPSDVYDEIDEGKTF